MTKYIFISLAVSVAASVFFYFGAQFIVFKSAHSSRFFNRELNSMVESLQYFISENNVSSEDQGQLDEWNKQNWYAFIRIYDENRVIYDSLFSKQSLFINDISEQKLESYQFS